MLRPAASRLQCWRVALGGRPANSDAATTVYDNTTSTFAAHLHHPRWCVIAPAGSLSFGGTAAANRAAIKNACRRHPSAVSSGVPPLLPLRTERRYYTAATVHRPPPPTTQKASGAPQGTASSPTGTEPMLSLQQHSGGDAKENDQRKEAMVHLARRTATLAAELIALKKAVEAAEAVAKQATQVTVKADQRMQSVEAHCASLAAKLEHVTLLASQSELRWKQTQQVQEKQKRDKRDDGAAVSDASQSIREVVVGAPHPPSLSSTGTLIGRTATSASPRASAAEAQREIGHHDRGEYDEHGTTAAAATARNDGTTSCICRSSSHEDDTLRLWSRIEALTATVAALQQDRAMQARASRDDEEGRGGLPRGAAAGSRDAPLTTTTTTMAAAVGELVPLRASVGPTGRVHVVGAQVLVRNVPGNVSANTIRTWCSTVGQVVSVLVVRPPRGGWATVARGTKGNDSSNLRTVSASDGINSKSMLVTFASVSDANDAVQHLDGFAWSGGGGEASSSSSGRSSGQRTADRQHNPVDADDAMLGATPPPVNSILIVEHYAMYDVAAEVSLSVGVRQTS